MNMDSVYIRNGFKNRKEYLEDLCKTYDREVVYAFARMFGPSEDFDGLVTELEEAGVEL